MVEIIVALSILGLVLTILAGTLTSSIRPILLSKQRAVATAAAQQILEQARSLNFNSLGLVSTDPTLPQNGGIDANISQDKFDNEPLVYGSNTLFDPHYVASFRSSSTTLSRWVWVTQSGNLKRVTVRVQWANPAIASSSPYVRASTLISSTAFTSASTPLTSATNVTLGKTTIGTVVDSTVDSISVAHGGVCDLDCGVASIGIRSDVSCSARTVGIDRTAIVGGSSFGGTTVTTLADDDASTAVEQRDGPTTVNATSGAPPADISPILTQPSLAGSSTCLSTVLGPDGVAGGDDDLPYGRGSVLGPAELTLAKDVPSLASIIPEPITLLSQTDADTATFEGEATSDMGPADTIVVTAKQRTLDTRVLALAIPPAGIAATYGLLRVEPVIAQAQVMGKSSGASTDPSVSNAVLRVWIYDPRASLPPAVCARRSTGAEPAGYCIVDHDISSPTALAPISHDVPIDIPGTGLTMYFSVNITQAAPTTSTQTDPRGTTWTSQAKPLVATVGLCITTLATCTPDGQVVEDKVLDLTASVDLGSVKAQAVYGFPV